MPSSAEAAGMAVLSAVKLAKVGVPPWASQALAKRFHSVRVSVVTQSAPVGGLGQAVSRAATEAKRGTAKVSIWSATWPRWSGTLGGSSSWGTGMAVGAVLRVRVLSGPVADLEPGRVHLLGVRGPAEVAVGGEVVDAPVRHAEALEGGHLEQGGDVGPDGPVGGRDRELPDGHGVLAGHLA